MKKQAKKSNTNPRKKSIDFQLKIVELKISKLNELKKVKVKKSEKKKIDSQLKVLKRKLKRLIKARLVQGKENLKKFETAKKKLDPLLLVVEKDLNILDGKIRLLENQLKKLRTEKVRINHKKKFLEKSFGKIQKSISEERKIHKKLESERI